MARMTLKPRTDRSTLLLCAGGGAFAVVATVALVGVVFTGSSLLGSVGAFTGGAAVGCLFGAFLPPGLMEELMEKCRSGEDYRGDSHDSWHNDPVYSDHPGNIWYTPPDQFDDENWGHGSRSSGLTEYTDALGDTHYRQDPFES